MGKFAVFSRSTLVGTSDLEAGDPPMGVAFGRFFPEAGYAAIRSECINNHADQTGLELFVSTSSGQVIECAGVAILDYSPEAGADGIEVNVLGIPYRLYEELLPDHVAAYERQFKPGERDEG